jgi:starch synthase
MKSVRVLSVTSELYPLVKTGGLADVAGALPLALAAERVQVTTLVPGYPAVLAGLEASEPVADLEPLLGMPGRLLGARAAGLDLLVLDVPALFDRPGNPYLGPDGRDWPDNGERFAALARVAAEIGWGLIPRYRPALVHAHDWQAALVSGYFHYGEKPSPPVVLTIHNLAFQGRFPAALLPRIGLPERAFTVAGVEYYGDIGFLKAGILFADRVTTVSPSYAVEILSEEGGMGLGGLLRGRSDHLLGILNGIDAEVWNPATDPLIPHSFTVERLGRRLRNKATLQERVGLDVAPAAPLFGVVSRLTAQKGLDLLVQALPMLAREGGQLVLLGTGDPRLEAAFAQAAALDPRRIACLLTYDEALAHLVQAGADALLVPSRFEPCGLTQLCALRYGALPVVARTGGLADTVIDANEAALRAGVATGFSFAPVDGDQLSRTLKRVIDLYRSAEDWRTLQRNGMGADFSWKEPARRYAALYRSLI